jgi:hypothetical protein
MRALVCFWIGCFGTISGFAQYMPDHIYMPEIHSVKLFQQGNQSSMAMIALNSQDLLELHFDDLSGVVKNYYYSFELCNADWTKADINVFDYIKGVTQNRLDQYRFSTIATSKYVHYEALLPEKSCLPVKSGNYLLKVFLDADDTKLAFTKRMMIVDKRVNINARLQQPFDTELMRTHQKLQFTVNTLLLNLLSPQQGKVVILQNNRWDNAITDIQPSFMRGNVLEYSGEQDCLFTAGKEYRWADLQSFRFLSDRIDRIDRNRDQPDIFIKPDPERNGLRYLSYRDRNGWEEINTTESVNPWSQTDYAYVHFSFVPKNNQSFEGKSVYLLGEMTANEIGDSSKMNFDTEKGMYTKILLLKQGYYSYIYVTKDNKNPDAKADLSVTEGNYWETENEYTILFYYRSFSSRYDELIGISDVNSRTLGTGF